FAHYLKDRPIKRDKELGLEPGKDAGEGESSTAGGLPEVVSFRTGANEWKTYDRWPPCGASDRRLFLRAGGRLAFEPPPAVDLEAGIERPAFDEYVSDPARPVPYFPRPIAPLYGNSQWPEWLVQDQRFAHLRPDVLSFETEPLAHDLDVVGPVAAQL